MNSRERVLAALRREEPDRVPYCELAIDRALAQKLMGWGEPKGQAANLEANVYTVQESKEIAERLNLDNISYVLRAPVYAHKVPGLDGRLFYGQGMIKTRDDLGLIQLPDPYDDALYAPAAEFARQKGEYAACLVTRVGIFPTVLSMGIENFSIALYEDLAFVQEVLDIYTGWTAVVAERVCQLGFDVYISTDDMAFKSAPFFSPRVFHDLVLPRYERVREQITLPWVIHSDGNMMPFMEDLIGLGIAGMHPLEKGAMDICAVKRDYGDRICLLGNVDLNLLGMGTPEDVDSEVRDLIRDVGPGGGYIVTSGNSLAGYLKPENVWALSGAVQVRAERLVAHAAGAGARLVVLPELFNTGYDYAESNYRRAELPDGPTVAWMRAMASRLDLHLAGSLMLLDSDEVYNALLLCAPDGRMWRYDKLYPWGWERAYFREGRGITVANTDLGRIGMLVCWDAGHPTLWRRYAGRVDLMLISSCPPDVSNPTYHLPNGDRLTLKQLGPVMASIEDTGRAVFGDMINEQTAWLRVPAVNTVGTGPLRLEVLHGTILMLSLVPQAPWLIHYLPQSNRMYMSCGVVPGCKIVDATGRPLTELTQEQGERVALAEVSLAETRPNPGGPQPPSRLPPVVYLLSDVLLPALCISNYRRGLRRTWGPGMAPVDAATRRWEGVLGLGLLAGLAVGWLLGRCGRKG